MTCRLCESELIGWQEGTDPVCPSCVTASEELEEEEEDDFSNSGTAAAMEYEEEMNEDAGIYDDDEDYNLYDDDLLFSIH